VLFRSDVDVATVDGLSIIVLLTRLLHVDQFCIPQLSHVLRERINGYAELVHHPIPTRPRLHVAAFHLLAVDIGHEVGVNRFGSDAQAGIAHHHRRCDAVPIEDKDLALLWGERGGPAATKIGHRKNSFSLEGVASVWYNTRYKTPHQATERVRVILPKTAAHARQAIF